MSHYTNKQIQEAIENASNISSEKFCSSFGYEDIVAMLKRLIEERDKENATVTMMQGAIAAQDERERQAGLRCKVLRENHGCDWPDAVADELLSLRATITRFEKSLNTYSDSEATIEDGHKLAQELRQVLLNNS